MTEKRIQENIREITNNEDRLGHTQVLLGSTEATALVSNGTITPISDLNGRIGWFLKNTVASTLFNFDIYNSGTSTMLLKKSDIRSLYFLGNIDEIPTGVNDLPILSIETKPTGSNDADPTYHSKYDFSFNTENIKNIIKSEQCLFYVEERPIDKPRKYQSQRYIKITEVTRTGELDEHGEISKIILKSSSSATINKMSLCLQLVGFETENSQSELEEQTPVVNFYFKTPETTQNSDLTARSIISDPNTSTFLNCDTNGHLSVLDSTLNAKWDNDITNNIKGDIDSINTNTATTDGKISKGDGIISAGVGLQQVLLYGKKPDGTLQPLETVSDRLLVDVVELAGSGPITNSTALASIQMCGIDKVSARFKTLDVNANGELSCVNKPFNENTKIFKGGVTLSSQTFNINDNTDTVDLGTKGLTTVSFNIISSSGAGGTGGIILEVSQDGAIFSPTKEFMPDTNASNNHFWYEQNLSIPHPFFRFFNNYSQNITVDIAGIVYK